MKYLSVLFLAALPSTASAAALWGQVSFVAGDPVPGSNPLTYCGPTNDYILGIDYIDIEPNPPVPGQNLTVIAKGTLKQVIEDGAYVWLDVKYEQIKLLHEKINICQNVNEMDRSCPINPGPITLKKKLELPPFPPGKYIAVADAYTKDGVHITCLTATILFKPEGHF